MNKPTKMITKTCFPVNNSMLSRLPIKIFALTMAENLKLSSSGHSIKGQSESMA